MRLFFVGVTAFAVIVFIQYCAAVADFPFETHGPEGKWAYKAWLLRNGQNIYPDLAGYPLLVTMYPPLYYALTALVMLVTGPTMLAGRLVSIVATVALGLALAALLYQETRRPLPSLLIGALLIASPYLVQRAPFAKSDTLALALGLWGAYFFERTRQKEQRSRLPVVAALLLAGAVYSKQTAATFALACVLSSVFRRTTLTRPFLVFAVTLLGSMTAIFLLLQLATQGQFYHHAIASAAQVTDAWGWSASILEDHLQQFWSAYWGVFVIAAFGLVNAAMRRSADANVLTHPLSLHLVVLVPFVWSLAGYGGGDINNLLPLIATAYWFMGLVLARVERQSWWRPVLVIALAIAPQAASMAAGGREQAALDLEARLQDEAQIAEIARSVPGDILYSEDASVFLSSGKPQLADIHELAMYKRSGGAIPGLATLLRDIERRRFDIIITGNPPILEDLRPAIALAYEVDQTVGGYDILGPRPGYVIGITDLAVGPGPAQDEVAISEELRHNIEQSAYGPFLAPAAGGRGWITYRLEAATPIEELKVTSWPRVEPAGPASFVVCEWSPDGNEFQELWAWPGDAAADASPLWGHSISGTADAQATTLLFLRFRLEGDNAQLWGDPTHPTVIQAMLEESRPIAAFGTLVGPPSPKELPPYLGVVVFVFLALWAQAYGSQQIGPASTLVRTTFAALTDAVASHVVRATSHTRWWQRSIQAIRLTGELTSAHAQRVGQRHVFRVMMSILAIIVAVLTAFGFHRWAARTLDIAATALVLTAIRSIWPRSHRERTAGRAAPRAASASPLLPSRASRPGPRGPHSLLCCLCGFSLRDSG